MISILKINRTRSRVSRTTIRTVLEPISLMTFRISEIQQVISRISNNSRTINSSRKVNRKWMMVLLL